MKEIPLTQGKVALVDDADYDWLSQWNWYTFKSGKTFYAVRKRSGSNTRIRMHKEICDGMVDHIDGDGLNNQRSNLRRCTCAENLRNRGPNTNNTSGFKGVSWDKSREKWQAQIKINRRSIRLGRFKDKIEAARAYDKAALKYHGEFANLNFK